MGADGGFIPKRTEIIRRGAKDEETAESARRRRLTHCGFSQKPLQGAIVVDKEGVLYSKVSLLQALVKTPEKLAFLTGIRSIREAREVGQGYLNSIDVESADADGSLLHCSISRSSVFRGPAVIAWDCGCVFLKRYLPSAGAPQECPNCGAALRSPAVSLGESPAVDRRWAEAKVADLDVRWAKLADERAQALPVADGVATTQSTGQVANAGTAPEEAVAGARANGEKSAKGTAVMKGALKKKLSKEERLAALRAKSA